MQYLFEHEQRLRRPDENLGLAVDHVVVEILLLDQNANAVAVRAAFEIRPRILRHHLVPDRVESCSHSFLVKKT